VVERSSVHDFIDAYRRACEASDAAAMGDLFGYPCQVTGDNGRLTVTPFPSRDALAPAIGRILSGYRAIGVSRVQVLGLDVQELSPRLAHALVRWRLRDSHGMSLYEFGASYTLADLGEGWRITAIAHNETAHLRAAMQRAAREA
jgi:hypothetical protein